MNFETLANLFEKLEQTTKRLEKILILKDFYGENEKDAPFVFDIIAGNYQRKINKKTIGISLKTIFAVLSFISKTPQEKIEKDFNKKGDLGILAFELAERTPQSSLSNRDLTLEEITNTFKQISAKTGKDSNKVKRELLSRLFLSSKNPVEHKFLARLLIDDLRIGTSEGTLREAFTRAIFPPVAGLFENVEAGIDFNSKTIPEWIFIKQAVFGENPREIYNVFLELVENKYNLLVSFEEFAKQLEKDKSSILKAEIVLGNPFKSMLGTRVKNVDEAYEATGSEILADYKYDGLRVQIHNDRGKVRLFSRNLDEITNQFPEVIEFIKENFSDLSFVIDSECVGYDYIKCKYLPFQMLSKRILTKDINEVKHINVSVKAFDLLYLNGKTLITKPYLERRDLLEELFLNRDLVQTMHFDEKSLE